MSVVDALQRELVDGVVDGRKIALEEAPTLTYVAGLKDPNYAAMKKPIYLAGMPHPILGQTGITENGEVEYVAVNKNIPHWVQSMMRVYNKGLDWAKNTVYKIAKLTTEHELAHAQSSRVARGEKYNGDTVALMESITTYAKHRTAKLLGKKEKAELIKATNPYPKAWWLGEIADRAPYEGPSGEGYAALIMDAQKEPFYKPLWRLTKAATKAAVRKGKDYLRGTGVPQYAMQAA